MDILCRLKGRKKTCTAVLHLLVMRRSWCEFPVAVARHARIRKVLFPQVRALT